MDPASAFGAVDVGAASGGKNRNAGNEPGNDRSASEGTSHITFHLVAAEGFGALSARCLHLADFVVCCGRKRLITA